MLKYRITLDLDKGKDLAKALTILRKYGFENLESKKSPSGTGHHVVAWRKRKLSDFDEFRIRIYAGDDLKRVWWDLKQTRAKQVLFSAKEVEIHVKG